MNGFLNYRKVEPYLRNLLPTSVQRIYQKIDPKFRHDPNDRQGPNDCYHTDCYQSIRFLAQNDLGSHYLWFVDSILIIKSFPSLTLS